MKRYYYPHRYSVVQNQADGAKALAEQDVMRRLSILEEKLQ